MSTFTIPTPQLSHPFVFRSADRLRIEGCVNAVLSEGMSLALHCDQESLLDHYSNILLYRLRQEQPDFSIETYFPSNTDALIARFNETLGGQSLKDATSSAGKNMPGRLWVVHDAHKLPDQEIQLLARLIQNFPGSNIRALFMMTESSPYKNAFSAFGRKILRWEIELPTNEQAQSAVDSSIDLSEIQLIRQLIRRMGMHTADEPMVVADAKPEALKKIKFNLDHLTGSLKKFKFKPLLQLKKGAYKAIAIAATGLTLSVALTFYMQAPSPVRTVETEKAAPAVSAEPEAADGKKIEKVDSRPNHWQERMKKLGQEQRL